MDNRKNLNKPKCLLDIEPEKTVWEPTGTGNIVKVDIYEDGSKVTHFGGPCGLLKTDANGDEC